MAKFSIRDRRKSLDLRLVDVASMVGVNKSTLARWETGETTKIPSQYLPSLAKALDVDVKALMPTEIAMVDTSARLPENSVPVYDGIACGTPMFADENLVGTLPVYFADADYRLVCRGDSMSPRLQDGDRVIIRKQSYVENGEIAVVLIDNERTLKRFYRYEDRIVLAPDNPIYSPIVIDKSHFDEVMVIGKALSVYHEL